MASSSSDAAGAGLSVLSYNVWGIFAAQRVKERMPLIAERLPQYDIVCLQEQFDVADCPTLFAKKAHPHVHRFQTAVVGSGLTIGSKFPIVSAYFVPFRTAGKIERLWEGDAVANKGVAVTRVAVPKRRLDASAGADESPVEVVVFNTHLIAQYEQYSKIGGYEKERNAGHRMTQAHQLAQLIVATVAPGGSTPFVVCGDFNCGTPSPEMDLIKAYLALYGLAPKEAAIGMSYTHENVFNARGSGTYLEVMSMTEDFPVQLDHVLFGTHSLQLVEGSGKICMDERITLKGGKEGNLSDHYGVCARFVLPTGSGAPSTPRQLNVGRLSVEDRRALAYAATFIRRRAGVKRKSIVSVTTGAAVLAVCCLACPAIFGGAPWQLVGVTSATANSALSFICGFAAALMLTLGQLYRKSECIAMTAAADDIEALMSTGTCCNGTNGGGQ